MLEKLIGNDVILYIAMVRNNICQWIVSILANISKENVVMPTSFPICVKFIHDHIIIGESN